MGLRKTILATGETYHIYNRGVEKRPVFLSRRDYTRFINLINYYRFANCPLKFSRLKSLSREERESLLNRLEDEAKKLVDILAFCLMPNHIHFMLRQLMDAGISKFMNKVSSGFSHYFNLSQKRVGPLFQGNFKAVRIEADEQFIHLSRYIHLNPVSSYLIEIDELENYDYSSYPEYLGKRRGFCNTKEILSFFKKSEGYREFVHDQVDYARELENIKHLSLE